MKRKEAREFVMQTLFQMEVQQEFLQPHMEKYMGREDVGEQRAYVETLISRIAANLQQIDEIIDRSSQGWPVSRMAKVDLAIIRLALGEILYIDDVPQAVAINEAVNLAKKFGADQSARFVNAVLAKAVEELE